MEDTSIPLESDSARLKGWSQTVVLRLALSRAPSTPPTYIFLVMTGGTRAITVMALWEIDQGRK